MYIKWKVYVNFQRVMNLTINSHRNPSPYFEEALVTVGTLWHPYSQASKKVKENMAMVWLVSLFLIGNPSYFLKKAY